MLSALLSIGYKVDIVAGDIESRKRAIRQIKSNIRRGVKYDFLYSESNTMPTLFSGRKNILWNLNTDFSFLTFCKKHGIPIGLFYRDVYWKFPSHKRNHQNFRYFVSKFLYLYDLFRYEKIVNRFYVPSFRMLDYVGSKKLARLSDSLPPGAENNPTIVNAKKDFFNNKNEHYDGIITLFYVGGVGTHYQFHLLLEAIKDLDYVYLTICCRKTEWQLHKKEYMQHLTSRVTIIHTSGQELETHYANAMIGLAFFAYSPYMALAMPVKAFEYLAHSMPIITNENTELGDFIETNGIGWGLPYDVDALRKLLAEIHENYDELYDKHKNGLKALEKNTWEKRAEKVRDQLLSELDSVK